MSTKPLLERIVENENHIFNKILDITPDCKSICSFAGNTRLVHGQKDFLELVGRDLVVRELYGKDKAYYSEEKKTIDNKRSDLLAQVFRKTSSIQNISEYKNLSILKLEGKTPSAKKKDFQKEVNDAFSQIENNYIEEELKGSDFFVTVVLTDVEKLYSDPLGFERFITTPLMDKAESPVDVFMDCGLYIETRRFSKEKDQIINDKSWNTIPNICLFETSEETDETGQRLKISRLADAVKFPFSSSHFGVKNVRDVKDPDIFLPKRILTEDIFDTTIKAETEKDFDMIGVKGKEKDFLYIEEETIFQSFEQPEGHSRFVIISMNGAIVDGQNSIDAFDRVLKVVNARLRKIEEGSRYNYEDLCDFEKRLLALIEAKYETKAQLEEYDKFLKKSYIVLKITKVKTIEEAKAIAASKNNAMLVGKAELQASVDYEKIQAMSFEIFKKTSMIIDYVKKENVCISQEDLELHGVHISELSIYNKMLKTKKSTAMEDTIAALKVFQEKETATTIAEVCEDFTANDSKHSNDEEKQAESIKIDKKKAEKKSLNAEIKRILNESIKNYESIIKANPSTEPTIRPMIDAEERKIEEKKEDLAKLHSEIKLREKKLNDSAVDYFVANNVTKLTNLMKSILTVRSTCVDNEDLMSEINLFNADTVPRVVFSMCLFRNNTDLHKNAITASEAKKVLKNLVEGEKSFSKEYPNLGLTDIRNAVEGEVVNSSGDNVEKEVARQFLLNEFLK
jgi:hypothetical protein